MPYKSASVFILAILFFLLINTTLGGARMVISLNGIWEASYDSKNFNLRLRVPGMVPIKVDTYPEPESLKIWYRRSFHVDKSFEKAFLKFKDELGIKFDELHFFITSFLMSSYILSRDIEIERIKEIVKRGLKSLLMRTYK